MVIIEIPTEEQEISAQIEEVFRNSATKVETKSFDGASYSSFIIPLAVILAPAIRDTILKILENDKVIIKHDGTEIQARGKRTAMSIYEQITKLKTK